MINHIRNFVQFLEKKNDKSHVHTMSLLLWLLKLKWHGPKQNGASFARCLHYHHQWQGQIVHQQTDIKGQQRKYFYLVPCGAGCEGVWMEGARLGRVVVEWIWHGSDQNEEANDDYGGKVCSCTPVLCRFKPINTGHRRDLKLYCSAAI